MKNVWKVLIVLITVFIVGFVSHYALWLFQTSVTFTLVDADNNPISSDVQLSLEVESTDGFVWHNGSIYNTVIIGEAMEDLPDKPGTLAFYNVHLPRGEYYYTVRRENEVLESGTFFLRRKRVDVYIQLDKLP